VAKPATPSTSTAAPVKARLAAAWLRARKARFSQAWMRAQGRWLMRLLRHVYRRFMEDDCPRNAAALTYMSLFAVVPLMTVVLAMLSVVPAFGDATSQLQSFVFSHFIPATGREIQGYLLNFSDQARKLTGIGIAFLLATALTMLTNIEKTFNTIWRTRGHRTGLSSFLRYWAILSLGPLCMGLALGISTYLVSLHWLDDMDIFGARKLLLSAAPLLLTSIAFTLLFAAIPNCRVPVRDAAIGGTICAICFEIAKQTFALVMANASYQVVYGTFAAIPLFLLWIYISWLIVLAGAELVHALAGFEERDDLPDIIAALAVLEILWRNHQRGGALGERELLRRRRLLNGHTLSAERWRELRDTLLDAALIKIDQGGGYILGRDLQHYSLADLSSHFGQLPAPFEPAATTDASWLDYYQRLLADLHAQNRERLQLPLAELFAPPIPTQPTAEHAGPGQTQQAQASLGARAVPRVPTPRQP
jgi:membrane protein